MKALKLYDLGHSQTKVSKIIARRHRIRVPQRTISSWIQRYAKLCPFLKLRSQAKKLCAPSHMVISEKLEHKQIYLYKYHQAKLQLLNHVLEKREDFVKVRDYLFAIVNEDFPHEYFTAQQPSLRSSKINANFLKVETDEKSNLANDLALHGLLLAKTNREHHEQIQDFMLINDSSTIACEVPVYLTSNNAIYFRQNGFQVPFVEKEKPITGHIDILQVRQEKIHILDYKPKARKVKPISQLTTYALALASRTRLPLRLFKCAWFDEKDYYQFSPLDCVRD